MHRRRLEPVGLSEVAERRFRIVIESARCIFGTVRSNNVIGGDSYYFGLFEQTTASIQQAGTGVDGAGGGFKVPETEGFKATVPKEMGGGGSAQMLLTSSVVDCTYGEVPPLQTTGSPIFYESFILSSPVALNFQNTGSAVTVISQSIKSGTTYDAYWYDVTNVSPSTPATLLLHTALTAPGDFRVPYFVFITRIRQFCHDHYGSRPGLRLGEACGRLVRETGLEPARDCSR